MVASFESKRFGFPVVSLVDRVGRVGIDGLVSRSAPRSREVVHGCSRAEKGGEGEGEMRGRRDEGKDVRMS